MAKHSSDKQPANSRLERVAEQYLTGAYIDLATLLGARFAAKDLKLQQRRKALSLLAGPNKTNFRGRGIDFEEVRAYQAGDDIRTIDWRVTARSGKAYTKLFREERERPVLVVTDQRQSMFFGSQQCFKSVMACYLGALIVWSGLQNSDRVGGLVFGNRVQREIRPRRSRQSALALMHLMLEYNQQLNKNSGIGLSSVNHLDSTLIELRRIAKPGSAIYLISDFAGFNDDNVQKHLHQLSKHCEITGLFVYDPLERELPPPGQYTVTDGSQRRLIRTGGTHSRERYTHSFDSNLKNLHTDLGKLGIPLIEVGTEQAPLERLMHYYGARR
jgi:uncharacterized protein (DUF58 family)